MDAPRQTSWPLAVTGNTIARRAVPSCLMPKTGVEGSRRSRAVSASPRRRVARSSLDHLGVTIRSTRPKRWSSVIARPPRGLPLVGGIRCCAFHRKDKASTRSTVCTQAAFTSRTTHSMSTGALSFFSHLAMAWPSPTLGAVQTRALRVRSGRTAPRRVPPISSRCRLQVYRHRASRLGSEDQPLGGEPCAGHALRSGLLAHGGVTPRKGVACGAVVEPGALTS